ncbi:MAG: cyclase family protein [Thermoanaerobaculaceae bacterium]|nr:cyclase family protein [Thermoanaerobaculaceae bacterium]MDI9622791.1 cyclase family protein [Acidobacteriota bacterium]NLH12281.1 cyclase family protein [Holophagae bacterium]HPW55326.1 cyclase family protein [Thermoanaerobaculaceae bacterium]
MRIIDLTHPLDADTPVYPGTASVRIEALTTVHEHGFAERLVTMASHAGTHMDAPAHLFPDGLTLDRVPPQHFVGTACVLDLTAAGPTVPLAVLERQADRLVGSSIVLLRTGWDRHWGDPAYYRGFPVLSAESARWLGRRGLTTVGVDAISFDPLDEPDLPVHRLLLGAGLLLVENLTGLHDLPPAGFTLCCLPLPLADADGAPCRAVAIIDDRP